MKMVNERFEFKQLTTEFRILMFQILVRNGCASSNISKLPSEY